MRTRCVAAVEPGGQLAVLRLVAIDVRVEQEQRVAADRRRCQTRAADRAGARLDRDRSAGRRLAERRLDRQRAAVDVEVVLVLPAVAIEPLPEVALVVEEADADQRNAEVATRS